MLCTPLPLGMEQVRASWQLWKLPASWAARCLHGRWLCAPLAPAAAAGVCSASTLSSLPVGYLEIRGGGSKKQLAWHTGKQLEICFY